MTVYFEKETEEELGFDYEKIINDCVNAACDYVDFPYEVSVNVLITGLEQIHEINKEQRGIDRPTDVLSFPMLEYEFPKDFSHIEDNPCATDFETGEIILGDIVLCQDKIFSQAKDYGHAPIRELAFLTVHSMLHLFGYDHEHEPFGNEVLAKMTKQMEDAQEEILTKLGITR